MQYRLILIFSKCFKNFKDLMSIFPCTDLAGFMIRPFSRFPRRTFNSLAAVASVSGYLLLGLHWRSDDGIVLSIVHAAGVLLSGVIAVFGAAAQPSKNRAFVYYAAAAACFAGIAVGIAVIVGVIPQSAAVIGTDSLSYRDWFLSGNPDLLVLISCLLLGLILATQFGGLEKRDFGLFAGAATGNVVWSYAFPSSPVMHTSSEASQS